MSTSDPTGFLRETSERVTRGHSDLLNGIHSLESALLSPAPRRERDWAVGVSGRLREVCALLVRHRSTVEAEDGLYDQLETAMPRTALRIQYLRDTNQSLIDRAELLLREVERVASTGVGAFMAVRSNAALLLGEMRHQQAREVDLIFEAFDRDMGGAD